MSAKIITLAHDKGGVGKTTIATNIIVQLLQEHKSISVIDLDPKKHLSIFCERRKDARIKLIPFSDVNDLKKILQSNDDLLIIDVGGMDSNETRSAIIYSDVVVTPLADSQIELDGLIMFKKTIERLQKARPDLRVTVLLNRFHPASNKTVKEFKEFIVTQSHVFNIFDTVVRDRAVFKLAYGEGKGVYEMNGAEKAQTEIYNLVKEL